MTAVLTIVIILAVIAIVIGLLYGKDGFESITKTQLINAAISGGASEKCPPGSYSQITGMPCPNSNINRLYKEADKNKGTATNLDWNRGTGLGDGTGITATKGLDTTDNKWNTGTNDKSDWKRGSSSSDINNDWKNWSSDSNYSDSGDPASWRKFTGYNDILKGFNFPAQTSPDFTSLTGEPNNSNISTNTINTNTNTNTNTSNTNTSNTTKSTKSATVRSNDPRSNNKAPASFTCTFNGTPDSDIGSVPDEPTEVQEQAQPTPNPPNLTYTPLPQLFGTSEKYKPNISLTPSLTTCKQFYKLNYS